MISHQKIVEIVSDATGELPHSLHFLGLTQRHFGTLSFHHLLSQALVRFGELRGPLFHAPLQRVSHPLQLH